MGLVADVTYSEFLDVLKRIADALESLVVEQKSAPYIKQRLPWPFRGVKPPEGEQ